MNVKTLVLTVIENVIKVIILAVFVMYIVKGITIAYDFGYKVFADEPMSANNGRIITVGVPDGASAKDVGAMLEEKGLIENAQRFVIQEYLSSYHDQIKPGIYDLSTGMTANEMIEIMSTEPEEEAYGGADTSVNPEENIDDGYADEELLDGEPSEDAIITDEQMTDSEPVE